MAQPSLLIPPQRFSTGKLFAYSPQQGTPVEFSVTRGTTAFRTNVSGTLQSVASGIARLDYRYAGALQSCPALLVEPAATNLVLRSEEFDNASWVKSSGGTGSAPVVTANNAVAPDGTMTADLISFNRGAGNTISDRSFIRQTPTVVSGTVYFDSLWLKAATPSDVGKQIGLRGVAGGTYLVITLTNDWVRYGRAETAISTTGNYELETRGTFTIDNAVSVHVWGADLKTSSVLTSYIPTAAATATRNADVISLTGASGYIGQTQGGVAGRLAIGQTSLTRTVMVLSDGTVNNRIHVYVDSSNRLNAEIVQGGITSATMQSAVLASGVHAYCLSYDVGTNGSLYVDGTLAEADTPPSVPACNQILFGSYIGGIEYYNGHLGVQALFKEALTTAELIDFSTL